MKLRLAVRASGLLNRLRIQQKLYALYVLAFLCPLLVLTAVLSVWLYHVLERQQRELSRASVLQTGVLLSEQLAGAEELSGSLFVNRNVQDTLRHSFESTQEVYDRYRSLSFLDDFLRADSGIYSFRYYTENATMLDNAYFIRASGGAAASPWYTAAKDAGGRILWGMRTDDMAGRRMLALTRAMYSTADGRFLGVLVVNLDSARIQRLLGSQEHETLLCVDGAIEFSSRPPEREGQPGEPGLPATFPLPAADAAVGRIVSQDVQWRGKASVASMYGVLGGFEAPVVLVQVIPRSAMMRPTVLAVLLCLMLTLCGTVLSWFLILKFSRLFAGRAGYVNREIKKLGRNDFALAPPLDGSDEFSEIYAEVRSAAARLRTLIAEVYQRKIEREQLLSRQNDIRFKMLASQINPHFLFNTLETIRMQALAGGSRDVAQSVKFLAKILRYSLSATDRPVPLMDEIDAVSTYLNIQHLRFAERVTYDIVFLCDVRRVRILPLLLQPLVENSFKHGLESRQEGGFIYILVDSAADGSLLITVQDNGCGIAAGRLAELREKLADDSVEENSSSIGLVNVNQRIRLFYGGQYGMEIESTEGKGMTVRLRVPADAGDKEEAENG